MVKKKLIKSIVVLGPTSSGKSSLAIQLAKEFNGEIISADSRQIYRHLDLGTGKIEGDWVDCSVSKIEACADKDYNLYVFDDIAHHLIDFVDPQGQDYNVSHFKKDCQRLIQDIHERGKLPIICGGTGFWISAIVDDLELPEVPPNVELRQELDKKSAEELYEQLKKLDPLRALDIDQKNKVRLIRAIEIATALGRVPKIKIHPRKNTLLTKTLSTLKTKFLKTDSTTYKLRPTTYLQLGIDHPKEILDQRIQTRLNERFQQGMIEEVKMLYKKYQLSWEEIQSFGLGYYWIPQFLQNKITEKEMRERTFLAERNYAKRQRTWFKRDKQIIWENDQEKIQKLVQKFLK